MIPYGINYIIFENKEDFYDKTSFETMWEKATCDLKDIIFCGF